MDLLNNTIVNDFVSGDIVDGILAHKAEIVIIVIVIIFFIILIRSKKKQEKQEDNVNDYRKRLEEINEELSLISKEKSELDDFYRKRAVYLRDRGRELSKEYNERWNEMKKMRGMEK